MKLIFAIAVLTFIRLVRPDDKIGNKCSLKKDCSALKHFTSFGELIDCIDNVCQCQKDVEVQYDRNLKPNCGGYDASITLLLSKCNATSCQENAECIDEKSCHCKEGFIPVDGNCVKVSYVNVLEKCNVSASGGAFACDISKYSLCLSGKCYCFVNYFPNITSGKCEPIADYLKANNLTEYHVRPNEYCREDSNCISGLKCRDYKCQCPEPCSYKKEEEICDCGQIIPPSKMGPIILGLILGLLVVAFWAYLIKRTIHKYTLKSGHSVSEESTLEHQGSPTSYHLNPVTQSPESSTAPPLGLSAPVNSNNQAYTTDPPPPYSVNPVLGEGTSLSPPYPTDSGINPVPGKITTVSPPYPTDSGINPVPGEGTTVSPPYPTDSGNLPYPTSPAAPDPSASAPPYPYGTFTDISKKGY